MKKIEYEIAKKFLDGARENGLCEIDGQTSTIYKWNDFSFYFADGKVFISGNVPLGLGYRFFLHFSKDETISFLGDNEKNERVCAISSLKTFIEFIFIIKTYKKTETIDECINMASKKTNSIYIGAQRAAYIKTTEEIHQKKDTPLIPDLDYDKSKLIATLCDLKNIVKSKIFKEMPKLPNRCFSNRSSECKWLLENIQKFSRKMTILERSRMSLQDIFFAVFFLDIDAEFDEKTGKITIGAPDDCEKSTYEYSLEGITYDFLYREEELKYIRIRYRYTYGGSNSLPRLWIELTPVITPRTVGPTNATSIYDLVNDRIFKNGQWSIPTNEDYVFLTSYIAYANMVLEEKINSILGQVEFGDIEPKL